MLDANHMTFVFNRFLLQTAVEANPAYFKSVGLDPS